MSLLRVAESHSSCILLVIVLMVGPFLGALPSKLQCSRLNSKTNKLNKFKLKYEIRWVGIRHLWLPKNKCKGIFIIWISSSRLKTKQRKECHAIKTLKNLIKFYFKGKDYKKGIPLFTLKKIIK